TYFLKSHDYSIRNISPLLADSKNLSLLFWIILIPFFIIFIKAFYDYIIAFCALNIMFYTVSGKTRVKNIDFSSHKSVIQRKIFQYILLMLYVTLILIIPPLVLWLFICLSFQVFSLEPESTAAKSLSRSVELIKGNIIPTIIMLVLCYIATYWFLPEMFIWASEKVSLNTFLVQCFEPFFGMLPLDYYNDILSVVNYRIDTVTLSRNTVEFLISFIIIGFTLPFRCCCFTQMYKLYDSDRIKEFSKESDEIIKRAAGKKRKN
ncbi:MAG: hypothetical protein LUG16_05160, partial [Candidatus Gastranaerophilales bacterium]|nr:hypothetical protein [Candidatus Gastranaerophilales bacterium]